MTLKHPSISTWQWRAALMIVIGSLCGCKEPASSREAHLTSLQVEAAANPADAGRDASRSRADEALAPIVHQLQQARRFTPDIVAALERLHAEAPDHTPTADRLSQAYIKREDWNALAQLLKEKPEAEWTEQYRIGVAKIMTKAQRFDEALTLLDPLVTEDGRHANVHAAWNAAYATFQRGDDSRALLLLHANFKRLVEAGYKNAYLLSAEAHFRQGDLDQAELLLTDYLSKHASDAPGHDLLGRVLAVTGDMQRARQHAQRANELRADLMRAQQKALRLSAMATELNAAYGRGDFDSCERIIEKMLTDAPADKHAELYKYLANVLAAQGRETEASEAYGKFQALSAADKNDRSR